MKAATRVVFFFIAVSLFAAGCSTKPPQQTAFMERLGVEDVTTRELQLIVYGMGLHFAGIVELAAQDIQENADTPSIQKDAILWKLNFIPLVYRSAFNSDPLGGMSSMWALAVQMRQYFTTGAGADVFGEWQYIAVDASNRIEAEVIESATSVLPDSTILTFENNVETWAENNRFTSQLFVRPGDSAQFLVAIAGASPGGLAAAASMHDQLRTVNDRTTIFTGYLPKQIQWHSELMAAQFAEFVTGSGDSVIATMEGRTATLFEPFLAFAAKEREFLTDYISEERTAILQAIVDERMATFRELEEERSIILERIATERNLTLEQMNAMTLAFVEQMIEESKDISATSIDRVFWRALQLLALPFMALLVLCVVVLIMIRNAIRRYLRIIETSPRGPGLE